MAKRQPNTSISAKSGKLLRFPTGQEVKSPLAGLPPIHYSAKDVARVVFWGSRESVSKFAKKVGEHPLIVTAVIDGKMAPTSTLLRWFGLNQEGTEYLWYPR